MRAMHSELLNTKKVFDGMSCTAWRAELNGVVCCAYHAMNSDLLNNLKVFNVMTCIAWCVQPSSVSGVQ